MKNILFILLFALGATAAHAQEVYNSSGKANYKNKKKQTGYDPDRLVLGGGMNFGIGGGYANIGISPIVGYRITDHFSAGIGLGYQYYKFPSYIDPFNNYLYTYMIIIYPIVWTRMFVYRNLFLSAGYEYDFITRKEPLDRFANLNQIKLSVTNQCLLIGVGIRQPIAGRLSFNSELFYDVLQGEYSPYPIGSPGIRFGIAAGF
jgi:hypothetical protein